MEDVKATFRKCDPTGDGVIQVAVFVDLIQKVCFPAVPADVITSIFEDFFGGTINPNGKVDYAEFIDWLSSSLDATGGGKSATVQGLSDDRAVSPTGQTSKSLKQATRRNLQCNLFMSNQQTAEAKIQREAWLRETTPDSIKVSLPPFNARKGVDLPPNSVSYNVATFGVRLPQAIMSLFDSSDMQALSKELQIPIPKYSLDTFIQKKMPKVMDLVAVAKKMDLDSTGQAAVQKVENFVKEFQTLKMENLKGPDDWTQFIGRHANEGWEDNLHFDSILPKIFGFDQNTATTLREYKITITEKDKNETVSLEHHALRWLSKAFKGYGPVGCLTDVVNLVYGIMGVDPPKEADEHAVIRAVTSFQDCLQRKDFSSVWIPTHMVHDGESDDALSWLLVEYMNRCQGNTPEILIQLPADEKQDSIAAFLEMHAVDTVQVFRDKEASNGKAVSSTWGQFV